MASRHTIDLGFARAIAELRSRGVEVPDDEEAAARRSFVAFMDEADEEEQEDEDYYEEYDENDDSPEAMLADGTYFADPGSGSALRAATRDNPRNRPCPTCKGRNLLTREDVARGYQCNGCADSCTPGSRHYQ